MHRAIHALENTRPSGRSGIARLPLQPSWQSWWQLGMLLLGLAIGIPAVPAQEVDPDPSAAEQTPSILRNGMLDMDYRLEVLGPDGKPVLSNVTLEELRRLKSQAAAASQLPAASFTSIQVDAVVKQGLAEVEGRFEVQLGESNSPARVSLRFDSCLLTEQPLQGGGDQSGRLNIVESGGYEWLLVGKENERQSIVLKGKSVVQQRAGRNTLNINLPMALTTIKVLLPANAIEIRRAARTSWIRTAPKLGCKCRYRAVAAIFHFHGASKVPSSESPPLKRKA